MRCPSCGMTMPDKERFCEYCGTDLHPERTQQADNPYQKYKQRQAKRQKQGIRERETAPVKERRASAQPATRRARTKLLPARSVGAAVAAATTAAQRFLPRGRSAAVAGVLGFVTVAITVSYLWQYGVGYASPHQLVLDFDAAVRAGRYNEANNLASGTMPANLMVSVARASLSETYPYHVERVSDSTRRIEYEDFVAILRRSMGKWTLTLKEKPSARSAVGAWRPRNTPCWWGCRTGNLRKPEGLFSPTHPVPVADSITG